MHGYFSIFHNECLLYAADSCCELAFSLLLGKVIRRLSVKCLHSEQSPWTAAALQESHWAEAHSTRSQFFWFKVWQKKLIYSFDQTFPAKIQSIEWKVSQEELRSRGLPLCNFFSPFWWNPFPQNSHTNGLYPAWIRVCVLSVELRLKAFPHWLHLWGFSCKKKLWDIF